MNTTTHHRTGTALAAVLVAFVLPLAACQTPRPAPVEPASDVHIDDTARSVPSPSPGPNMWEYQYGGSGADHGPEPTVPPNGLRHGAARAF